MAIFVIFVVLLSENKYDDDDDDDDDIRPFTRKKRILFNAPTKQFQVPTQVDKLKGILSLINVIF